MSIEKFVPHMMGVGKGRHPQTTPAVNITVGRTARFHFNSAAILRYLGNRTCVEYFYDKDKCLIGFRFYEDKKPQTYTLTLTRVGTSDTSRVVASAAAFLDFYGLREKLKSAANRTFVLYTSNEDSDLVLCDISEVFSEGCKESGGLDS